jgi:hypothetical protein
MAKYSHQLIAPSSLNNVRLLRPTDIDRAGASDAIEGLEECWSIRAQDPNTSIAML